MRVTLSHTRMDRTGCRSDREQTEGLGEKLRGIEMTEHVNKRHTIKQTLCIHHHIALFTFQKLHMCLKSSNEASCWPGGLIRTTSLCSCLYCVQIWISHIHETKHHSTIRESIRHTINRKITCRYFTSLLPTLKVVHPVQDSLIHFSLKLLIQY